MDQKKPNRGSKYARVFTFAIIAIVLLGGVRLALSMPVPPQGASRPAAKLMITTKSLRNATVGVEYNTVISAAGGDPPYDFSGTGLPPNLAFHYTSDTIGGKAMAPGTYDVVLTVTDSSDPKGQTASANFKLTVVPANK